MKPIYVAAIALTCSSAVIVASKLHQRRSMPSISRKLAYENGQIVVLGSAEFFTLKSPRPIDEVLGFIEKYRYHIAGDLYRASFEGANEKSTETAKEVVTLLSDPLLKHNYKANFLRGLAYELQMEAALSKCSSTNTLINVPEDQRKNITDLYNKCILYAEASDDIITEMRVRDRFGAFLDLLNQTREADFCFLKARDICEHQLNENTVVEHYVMMSGEEMKPKIHAIASKLLLDYKADHLSANAQHEMSEVNRTSNLAEKALHWKLVMVSIHGAIEGLRTARDYPALAHALAWRAHVRLLKPKPQRSDFALAYQDASESISIFTQLGRQNRVAWYECAAGTVSAVKALIRMYCVDNQGKNIVPANTTQLHNAAKLALDQLQPCPPEAPARDLSDLLGDLGAVYALLSQCPDAKPAQAQELRSKAALAYALADQFGKGTMEWVETEKAARRIVSAKLMSETRARVQKVAREGDVRSFIAEPGNLNVG